MIQPQMSTVLSFRNPELKDTDSHPELLTMITGKDFTAAPPARGVLPHCENPPGCTFHYFDGRTKAQRGNGAGPRTHHEEVTALEFTPRVTHHHLLSTRSPWPPSPTLSPAGSAGVQPGAEPARMRAVGEGGRGEGGAGSLSPTSSSS